MSLDKLQTALNTAIDKIGADGSGGEAVVIPNDEPEPREAAGDEDEPGQREAGDDDESDLGGEGATPKEAPAAGKDGKEKGAPAAASPAAEGAPSKESPSATPSTTDEAARVKDILSTFSQSTLNGLKKFVPGGDLSKITTLADLRAVNEQFGSDYWRNQGRLAELSKRKPGEGEGEGEGEPESPSGEAEPKTKPAAEVPEALRYYDAELQTLQTKGKDAAGQHDLWLGEKAKALKDVEALEEQKAVGDENFSQAKLDRALARARKADENIQGWKSEFANLRARDSEIKKRRAETKELLDIKSRLDRQDAETRTRQQQNETTEYDRNFKDTLKAVFDGDKDKPDTKIPARFHAQLQDLARIRVHRYSTQNGTWVRPEEMRGFLAKVVADEYKTIKDEIEEQVKAAQEQYTKDKAADAPKKPGTKKTVAPSTPGDKKKVRSLDELQSKLDGDPGWDNTEA